MENETGEPKFLQQSEDVWEQTKKEIECAIERLYQIGGIHNDTTHNNGHWNVFRAQLHS